MFKGRNILTRAEQKVKNKIKCGRLMIFICPIVKYTLKQFPKNGEDANNSFISVTYYVNTRKTTRRTSTSGYYV